MSIYFKRSAALHHIFALTNQKPSIFSDLHEVEVGKVRVPYSVTCLLTSIPRFLLQSITYYVLQTLFILRTVF